MKIKIGIQIKNIISEYIPRNDLNSANLGNLMSSFEVSLARCYITPNNNISE